jgi:DNA-binding NtrC family response regulator
MDTHAQAPPDAAVLRRERDLYLRLLELGHESTLAPFLKDALALLVEITGAQEGYLELYDDDDEPSEGPQWWIAHGLSSERIDHVRATISRGIIAESIASGRTIVTAAAILDPRFSHRESVRRAGIQAVLCAPVGADRPRGVLYLTGRAAGQPFSEEDRARVELVTRHLAPASDRLLLQARAQAADDPTRTPRASLRADGLIGRSPALAAVLQELAIAAPTSKTVLLTGETGTGKTQLARVIHDNSPRHRGPFVEVSCTNLPEGIVESELFGAKRGAASGVDRDRIGYVAQAEHGTLFLDEIGDMPLTAQAKLLQLLQSKQYNALGSPAAVQADVRVLAGTNVDLRRAVAEGKFRQDLLYRLDVITIRLPSLAERRGDIRELAAFFCAEECRKEGFPPRVLSREALRALEAAEWPGNVRDLSNAMARGLLRAVGDGALQVERRHLFPDAADPAGNPGRAPTYEEAVNRFKARLVRDTLELTGWNVAETAKRLDLARSHLYNLIGALGIERERRP